MTEKGGYQYIEEAQLRRGQGGEGAAGGNYSDVLFCSCNQGTN